jgi:hypothetical protein
MLAATWTEPLAPRDADDAIAVWLDRLFSGEWANTLYEQATGPGGAVLLPVLAAMAAGSVVAAHRAGASRLGPPPDTSPS